MIWLASFPRSGNTFFRIVLDQVYGIRSGHLPPLDGRKEGWEKGLEFPVVKTHLRPSQLIPDDPEIPAVYLVRDGRDALVSMAHHRKDIVAPGSNFLQNLSEAMRAEDGSFFGGWSRNVEDWLERASIVVRFEDLIREPIATVEKLRAVMELPAPDASKLPTFEDLRAKQMPYQGRGQSSPEWRQKFFRRGKANAWKDEMPQPMQQLFWDLHGTTMEKLGYTEGRWAQTREPRKWYRRLWPW